jgi:hypothetical protein
VKLPALAAWACALSLAPLFATPSLAQVRDERAVKVAFVFNLTKYVEWPRATNELVIGFVGDATMGEILQKMLAGKSSESRPIHVLLSPSDEQLEQCNVVYIADSSPKEILAALNKVRTKNILTVGDSDAFAREGGMVGLVTVGEQIQIQVNLQAAQDSRLKISSRLLNLSTIVRTTPEARN